MKYFDKGNAHQIVTPSLDRDRVIVVLSMHDRNVEIAVGVSYEYLNADECRELATVLLVAAQTLATSQHGAERAEDV